MTIYSQISEQIGWDGEVLIPTLETAQNLHQKVTEEKCENAFKQVFKIYRFAELAETRLEAKAMALIEDAYGIGRKHFISYDGFNRSRNKRPYAEICRLKRAMRTIYSEIKRTAKMP